MMNIAVVDSSDRFRGRLGRYIGKVVTGSTIFPYKTPDSFVADYGVKVEEGIAPFGLVTLDYGFRNSSRTGYDVIMTMREHECPDRIIVITDVDQRFLDIMLPPSTLERYDIDMVLRKGDKKGLKKYLESLQTPEQGRSPDGN